MRAARKRTESMAQRLAKKPISEGYELWDKGFYLGAMRLFIFKAESSPPFQLGPCLDAVAHLLQGMDELVDAAENFGFAAEKYDLIQQPTLAKLMQIKMVECAQGVKAALPEMDAFLKETDPERKGRELTELKAKAALARVYHARALMLLEADSDANAEAALADATYAAELGWDRVHLAYFVIGRALEAKGDLQGAVAAFEKTIATNGNFLEAFLAQIPLTREIAPEKTLAILTSAIAVHPRSALIREKAFLLSESGSNDEALALLDAMIAEPPVEEADGISFKGSTEATLFKAKAAILADLGRMGEALEAGEKALAAQAGDEEAEQIVADIKAAIAQPAAA